MSGSTRSMPGMSAWGNMRPASTTRIFSSHSRAHMLMPTSPRPPSGTYRSRGDCRGPREITPQALISWGLSQEAQLFRLLLRGCDRHWWWRRSQQLVQVCLHAVEIVLEISHQRAVVQRGGRVVERHIGDATAHDKASVNARARALAWHEALERVPAQDQQHLRRHQLELALEIWRACFGFVGHRIPVHRRAALEHVGDVHVQPAETDPGQERVEQLARGTDERFALTVLVEARSFTDDQDVGGTGTDSGDRLRASCV